MAQLGEFARAGNSFEKRHASLAGKSRLRVRGASSLRPRLHLPRAN
jgi:hypothetical protein